MNSPLLAGDQASTGKFSATPAMLVVEARALSVSANSIGNAWPGVTVVLGALSKLEARQIDDFVPRGATTLVVPRTVH